MASTNIRLAVEKELEFYARFPEEISLFYNDDLENGIYFKMPKKEFDNLVSEIGKIIYAADHQVKEIIDAFVSEVKRKDLIKIDPMKNQQRLWRCRIKCVPKESGDSISNIWIGLIINPHGNKLIANCWIWVRGVNRSEIHEILKQDVQNASILDKTPNGDGWEKDTLCFASENLYEVSMQKESLDDFAKRLAKPILQISLKSWKKLFDLAKK